jgi:excinuclease UvrABC nuclease subunit
MVSAVPAGQHQPVHRPCNLRISKDDYRTTLSGEAFLDRKKNKLIEMRADMQQASQALKFEKADGSATS